MLDSEPSRVRRITAGVVTVVAALAAGQLVSTYVSVYASPYYAVASLLIDRAPTSVRELAITTFGTKDKLFLLSSVGAGVVLIAVAIGLVERRRRPYGCLLLIATGLTGCIAALIRPTSDLGYAIPSLCSIAVGLPVLRGLLGYSYLPRRRAGTESGPGVGRPMSRRRFVTITGSVLTASAAIVVAGRALTQHLGSVVGERLALRLPRATNSIAPVPSGADLTVSGATPFLTSNADFYRIDTALQVPALSITNWRLRVHGMVENEFTLDWDDLMRMPAQQHIMTLTCVSNEVGGDLASNATWLGIAMATVLGLARPHADADMLLSTSVDGWTCGTPISAITDGRTALLAIGMNGQPLPQEHGYPVRQVVPGLYGYASACKWVVDWEVTRFDRAQSYWTRRGWSRFGPIKTASRIDRPEPLSTSPPGVVVVAGTAWAQHRGIERVEVRVDDGPWSEATLATDYSDDCWRQWSWVWSTTRADVGDHVLSCRATDKTGTTQPQQRVPPIPDGATGWHTRVLRIG